MRKCELVWALLDGLLCQRDVGILQGWGWLFFIAMCPEMPHEAAFLCWFCVPFPWCISRPCVEIVTHKKGLDAGANSGILCWELGVIKTHVHAEGQDGLASASSSFSHVSCVSSHLPFCLSLFVCDNQNRQRQLPGALSTPSFCFQRRAGSQPKLHDASILSPCLRSHTQSALIKNIGVGPSYGPCLSETAEYLPS